MPYSHNSLNPIVNRLLQQIRPAMMLDIGAGAGKYGSMMRAVEAQSGLGCLKIAVEICPEYIDRFNLRAIYDEIWITDAYELIASKPDLSGDLVILGDCIEHMPKSRGIDLIEYLLYRFKHVLVIFPIDLPQGAWEGYAREAHVSLWYPEDFVRYKATTYTSHTKEGYDMCLALMNGVFVPPDERLRLEVSGPYVSKQEQ